MARPLRYSGKGCLGLFILWLLLQAPVGAFAQRQTEATRPEPFPRDATLDIAKPTLESALHTPLNEQYIWSPQPGSTSEGIFICLRKFFTLKKVPPVATLYAAGPSYIRVYINGRLLAAAERDAKDRVRPFLLAIDVSGQLRPGRNLIAVTVQGERLVLKIVPAPLQVVKPALVVTDATWKCGDGSSKRWESAEFDDHAWPSKQKVSSFKLTRTRACTAGRATTASRLSSPMRC